ncbi:MAG: hypothetical protein HYZ38_20625 [Mycobacterium sp.]|nr:hypothetical protein [Mycobacterium sp.]
MTPRIPTSLLRGIAAVTVMLTGTMPFASPAQAAPVSDPYPDTSGYRPVSSTWIYRVVNEDGVWFTSPVGVRCGIADDGSYGCSGALPGVSAGENEVAWFVGDPFPRLYHSEEPRFSSPAAQTLLRERMSIEYRGSRCSTTRDSGIYCIHGNDPNSQLMVTTTMVWRGADAVPGG